MKIMDQILMLRFRDLVTEPGGTILEHEAIIVTYGEVWWGWWMREQEEPPRKFLAGLMGTIEANGFVRGLLYDASRQFLYASRITKIKVSPTRSGIAAPEPAKAPEYYHQGRYPVWFLLTDIRLTPFERLDLRYASVPSNNGENQRHSNSVGNRIQTVEAEGDPDSISSLRDLRNIDVTMWELEGRVLR